MRAGIWLFLCLVVLVGLITALFNRLFLTILDNMDAADVTGALLLELVLPISSYFVAEEIHASGIIAVVVAGISLASRFKKSLFLMPSWIVFPIRFGEPLPSCLMAWSFSSWEQNFQP